jgi:hypothetical protein
MYIIDKNKDFYDHYSYIYGVDKNITFDRRGSILINNNNLIITPDRNYINDNARKQFILLETGLVQYLIKISNIDFDKKFYNEVCFIYLYKNADFEIVNKFETFTNKFGCAISIHSVYNDWHTYCPTGKEKYDYTNYRITNDFEYKLPILANTHLTSILDPDELWKNINTYISSLSNDKYVDIGTTDIEKVVNHGFDKKESFRGKPY